MPRFQAVVFDWAGTVIDFGCFAPMGAFVEALAAFGVAASIDDARGPMGLPKRDHIRALLALPHIGAQWTEAHGAAPDERAVDQVFRVFVPLNEEVASRHAALVPGAGPAVAALRARGLRIGSTTGYTRSIMARILPVAAAQGYAPDCLVCADDVAGGRPGPEAMQACLAALDIAAPALAIKVDDTEPGIAEGVAAGCVTVGVALSGNYVGRTPEQLLAMAPDAVAGLRDAAAERLRRAGADHVIDTVADLPALVALLDPG
ncbi:MAG: phosphonoacetaldehyde hydrolase [Alphaproteobacteria bacterium]